MKLRRSEHGWFYGCTSYPLCQCTHGCHQGGSQAGKPLGRPADKETRAARRKAHAAFDKLWLYTSMTRNNAYRWLSKVMNTKGECHIASLSKKKCEKVVELSKKKLKSLKRANTLPQFSG